jgi:superfamily II DNA or RNA helicase
MTLLPHQAAFVEAAFSDASKRVIVLRGGVGLGKSAALVAVSGRFLRDYPLSRVLFLVPAMLQLQFVERLQSEGISAFVVDRFRFRELLDAGTNQEIWPRGAVLVFSLDLVRQPDIRESLVSAIWDLVVVDEAHLMSKAVAGTIRLIATTAKRVILSTATPRTSTAFDLAPEETTVVEWGRATVVGPDGKPLYTVPRPNLHEVPFILNPAESTLRARLQQLCNVLVDAEGSRSWRAKTLLRSLESSPAAVEGVLQRLAEVAGIANLDEINEIADESFSEVPAPIRMDPVIAEKVAQLSRDILQEIEHIDVDSKLAALVALLKQIKASETTSLRICVLTDFKATLYYVASEVESHGTRFQLLHGAMRSDERHKSLQVFSNEGDVLLATVGVMQGIDLSRVTDLILYDMPDSDVALQQVISRFERFGRFKQLNVYAFKPSNIQGNRIEESLWRLRDILGSPVG